MTVRCAYCNHHQAEPDGGLYAIARDGMTCQGCGRPHRDHWRAVPDPARLPILEQIAERARLLVDTYEQGEQITKRTLGLDMIYLKRALADLRSLDPLQPPRPGDETLGKQETIL